LTVNSSNWSNFVTIFQINVVCSSKSSSPVRVSYPIQNQNNYFWEKYVMMTIIATSIPTENTKIPSYYTVSHWYFFYSHLCWLCTAKNNEKNLSFSPKLWENLTKWSNSSQIIYAKFLKIFSLFSQCKSPGCSQAKCLPDSQANANPWKYQNIYKRSVVTFEVTLLYRLFH